LFYMSTFTCVFSQLLVIASATTSAVDANAVPRARVEEEGGTLNIHLRAGSFVKGVVVTCGGYSDDVISTLSPGVAALRGRPLRLIVSETSSRIMGMRKEQQLLSVPSMSFDMALFDNGVLKLEVPINLLASAIALTWDGGISQSTHASKLINSRPVLSVCGSWRTKEVAVLTKFDKIVVPLPPQRNLLSVAQPGSPEFRLPSEKQVSQVLKSVGLWRAPVSADEAVVKGFLAPREDDAAITSSSSEVFAVWLAVLAIFSVVLVPVCLANVRRAKSAASASQSGDSFPWLLDCEATDVDHRSNAEGDSAAAQFFFIGDSDVEVESDRVATAAFLLQTEEHINESTSQHPALLADPITESEPEAEVYPESCEETFIKTEAQLAIKPAPTVRSEKASASLEQPPPPFVNVRPKQPQSKLVPTTTSHHQHVQVVERLLPQPTPVAPSVTQREFVPAAVSRHRGQGKVLMLYASPLCYMDRDRCPVVMPSISFEREWDVLLQAYNEAVGAVSRGGPRCEVRRQQLASLAAQPLTAGALRRVLVPNVAGGLPTVLHLSAHGVNGSLVLDDGVGTAHFFGCDLLSSLLQLRQKSNRQSVDEGPRLVFINACSSVATGNCLAEGGVPHVLCSAVDVRDSWSQLFLHSFYTALFQGESVLRSFEAAIFALQCDPEIPSAAAAAFRLLPEAGNHDEVLFPLGPTPRGRRCLRSNRSTSAESLSDSEAAASRSCSESDAAADSDHTGIATHKKNLALPSTGSRRASAMIFHRSSPFGRSAPVLPEDFVGRSFDVWSVLQLLSSRRAVVVCGADDTDCGIGKSAIIDAVHRNLAYQQGNLCLRVDLAHARSSSSGSDENLLKDRSLWSDRVGEKARRASQEERRRQLHSTRAKYSGKAVASTSFVGRPRRPYQQHRNSSLGAGNSTFEKMVAELAALGELWEETQSDGDWSYLGSSSGKRRGIVLVLEGCEALILQQDFQEAIGEILRVFPTFRVLFGTQQRMPAVGGQFKVVHHAVGGLSALDSARLFLRRTHRPIRWGEVNPRAAFPNAVIALANGNEAEVLAAVAAHPAVAATQGHPRALIQLAGRVGYSLDSLDDLVISNA
jgi:hypothetical protein